MQKSCSHNTLITFHRTLKFLLFLMLFMPSGLKAQIYAPEGLNMPGDWDGWTNPPSSAVLAGDAQTSGGALHAVPLGTPFYQTTFAVGDDVAAGSWSFKFTSGPLTSIWQNQWGNVAVQYNTLQEYTYGVAGTAEPDPNTITLTDGKWVVMNWYDKGYESTDALFMELSSAPATLTAVQQEPLLPGESDPVTVTVTLDKTPAAEEKIFVRYSDDGWQTAQLLQATATGTSAGAVIPAMTAGTTVSYYAFSTVFADPSAHPDLYTLRYLNNNGNNYDYTVGDTLGCGSSVALVSTEPPFTLEGQAMTLTFNAALGNGGLAGYAGEVYAHTGVITNMSSGSSDWKYVKTDWGENTPETHLTSLGGDLYELTINDIRSYYGVPAGEEILQLAFVFRSDVEQAGGYYLEGKTSDNQDIFTDVYHNSLQVRITWPDGDNVLAEPGEPLPVCVASLLSDSLFLSVDQQPLAATADASLFHILDPGSLTPGTHWLIAEATAGTDVLTDSVKIFVRGSVPVADLPEGMKPGVNVLSDNSVTLVLEDPAMHKDYAFVLGDMNGWQLQEDYYMNRTPDGRYHWLTISGLTPGTEYAYQYLLPGGLRIADPYTDKVLDPWNDKWIPEATYPGLKDYPTGLTTGIVSVLQTGRTPYNWQVEDFTPVAVDASQSNLIIYELLVRDFVEDRRISSVMDSLDYLQNLGVNAIELMPVNEFEGNDSWGYNPSFYFAPDKAYGTMNDYKAFIDACHQRGIAVIFDIVLNHSFGQSPLVRMYWDAANNAPSADNPWYNVQATHPLSPGYDFNHESSATKDFVKRVLQYWIEEYKVDGYRFDLSKGFTQTWTGEDIGAWSQYDQSRVNILTDYYNFVKSVDAHAYFILEHLSDNSEEVALANTGMLPWGKMTEQFNQCTMGWADNSNYSWGYYSDRGYTYPNLIPFMESHDEERLPVKNIAWGNGSGDYQITDTLTSLARMEAIVPMYFMVPGPKMIWQFGELGYDYSINYCGDGSVSEECRTWAKPVRWDFWDQPARQRLYRVYAAMAQLKTQNEAFGQGTYGKDLGGRVKRAWVSHSSLNVCAGSNTDVVSQTVDPGFQHGGTWYNYFTGEAIEATTTLTLEPGGYYVFTDQQEGRPFVNATFEVLHEEDGSPIGNALVELEESGSQVTDNSGMAAFVPLSNQTLSYTVTAAGASPVTGTITLGLDDLHTVVTIRGADDINDRWADDIKVYPNPARDWVVVECEAPTIVYLSSFNGGSTSEFSCVAGQNIISTSNLRNGLYLLRFVSPSGNNSIVKLIVNQ